jgi:hypothetical protein
MSENMFPVRESEKLLQLWLEQGQAATLRISLQLTSPSKNMSFLIPGRLTYIFADSARPKLKYKASKNRVSWKPPPSGIRIRSKRLFDRFADYVACIFPWAFCFIKKQSV